MDVNAVNQTVARLTEALNSHPLEQLVLNEGTVYGARYYTVQPMGGDWRVIEKWAIQTYGDPGVHMWGDGIVDPGQRWYMNNRKFWFRNEADRTLFLLKWQ
jgi:hypothetical protein